MTPRGSGDGYGRPRVGLFGLLGAGNIGNDGSLEAVLAYLDARHPDAALSCLCSGPDQVLASYGIPSRHLHWYDTRGRHGSRPRLAAMKAIGKFLDAFRTLRWIRRQDVVIVPGAGVLETTQPLRPWGFPYALLLLCASGAVTGTKVALVNVGANVIRQPSTRLVATTAARLAYYRSFRDENSRQALATMGVDTSTDDIYPDLVFALPVPQPPTSQPPGEHCATTVGVGVMAFHGSNDDRRRAEALHESYVAAMKKFVRKLIETGRRVRLFIGDQLDDVVVRDIIADVRGHHPELTDSCLHAEPISSLRALMREMSAVDLIVATRYHNVVCGLKLAKPTISISYSAKSDHVMASMGQERFCQSAHEVDVDLLLEQVAILEQHTPELLAVLAERTAANIDQLERQYDVLSGALFGASDRESAAAGRLA